MCTMRGEVFERLYERHADSLLAFLVYRCGDRALAEDLLADTFERVLRARRPFDPRRSSERTWVYAIALNCLRDHARRRGAEERAYEKVGVGVGAGVGGADAFGEELGARDELQRALGRLAPEERDAIALRFGGDLTMPEIARLTGEPLTTVEGRVYRALRKLKDELE
jgi:RNA polymerase sigma factor (sigma-70 family)